MSNGLTPTGSFKVTSSSSGSTVTPTKLIDYGNFVPVGTGGGAQSNMELDDLNTDKEADSDNSTRADAEDNGLIEE